MCAARAVVSQLSLLLTLHQATLCYSELLKAALAYCRILGYSRLLLDYFWFVHAPLVSSRLL